MTEQQEFQLNRYLKTLWKGKWLILLSTVVMVMAVIAFRELQPTPPPSYSAIATVRVEPVSSPAPIGESPVVRPDDRGINTQVQIMVSRNVINRAVLRLNPEIENAPSELRAMEVTRLREAINVRPISNTNLVEVTAQAPNPPRAQAMADAVVDSYIEYVKEERTQTIEDSLRQVESRLEEVQTASQLDNRLALMLPGMATELSSLAHSVDRSRQMVGALNRQQSPHGEGSPLSWEAPHIEAMAATLRRVSQDLQRIREGLTGAQQRTFTDGDSPSSLQSSQMEKVAEDLDVVTERLREIRSGMATTDPRRSLETAATRAEDAKTALDQVPRELARVNTLGETDIAEQLHSVRTFVESVSRDLDSLNTQMGDEASRPAGISQSEMIILRGQLSAHAAGLRGARNQIDRLRSRVDFRDLSYLAVAEEFMNSAVSDLERMATDLEGTTGTGTAQEGMTEIIRWIEESSSNLRAVSENFGRLEAAAGSQEGQRIASQASYELEEISLTLEAAVGRMRSLRPRVTDPQLSARMDSAISRVGAAQTEVAGASARLGVARLGQFATLPEGIRAVQERVEEGANVLERTVDLLDPSNHGHNSGTQDNPAALVYSDTVRVVNSLDIATRQLQELERVSTEPLTRGEMGVITDRLIGAREEARGLSNRLSRITGVGSSGNAPRTLGALESNLEVAVNALEVGAEAAQRDMLGTEGEGVREDAGRFVEQADIASSILSLVVEDLIEIQRMEVDPVRHGQLGVLAERVRGSQNQIRNVSNQMNQIQQGRGVGQFELQQRKADLELALLQPQETGITKVDSALNYSASSGSASFVSRVRIPLAVVAGFLLGSLAVLVKGQIDPRIFSQDQLRDRAGVVTLGVVPKSRMKGGETLPLVGHRGAAPFSEAIQLLGVNLTRALDNGVRSYLITSGTPHEGKTMMAVNLAHVLANSGYRVLLVDANLRNPRVAQALNLPEEDGLATALARQDYPGDYILASNEFWVLPGGRPPSNPVELLSSAAMTHFLQQASKAYDAVLIDSPPVLGFAETKAMAKGVSGALLVVKSGVATVEAVEQSREELELEGIKSVVAVLNFAPAQECNYLHHKGYGRRDFVSKEKLLEKFRQAGSGSPESRGKIDESIETGATRR